MSQPGAREAVDRARRATAEDMSRAALGARALRAVAETLRRIAGPIDRR